MNTSFTKVGANLRRFSRTGEIGLEDHLFWVGAGFGSGNIFASFGFEPINLQQLRVTPSAVNDGHKTEIPIELRVAVVAVETVVAVAEAVAVAVEAVVAVVVIVSVVTVVAVVADVAVV